MKKLLYFLFFTLILCCESTTKPIETEVALEDGWIKSTNGCLVYEYDLQDTDSITWSGDCFENKISGFGILKKFSDKELVYQYEGNYINGEKLGLGKQTYLNGSVYEGEFYYSPHGSGKKISPDGSKVYGIFRLGDPLTVVNITRDGRKEYIYEYDEIDENKAIEMGIDKWSIDKVDYKLNNHISPNLNVLTTLYYDEDWNLLKDNVDAKYYRLVTFVSSYKVKDNLIQDFYITGERQNKYYAKYVDINNSKLEIRHGEDIGFWKNGEIERKGNYINGKLEGPYISNWQDGSLESEGVYKKDKKDGIWKEYWENGNLERELTFVDGILNGQRTYWYESGNLQTVQFSKNDLAHGDFVWYYDQENQVKRLYQSYTDGEIIPGSRYQFDKDGSGERVYVENFSWNFNEWEAEGKNYSWSVNDNNNLIIDQSIGGVYITNPIDFIDTEKVFSFEVVFNKLSGKNLNGTGMYLNYKDDENYTKFIVSSDGYYRIDQYFLGVLRVIKKWTKSSHINRYSGANTLKVISLGESGESVVYSINNEIVHNSEVKLGSGNQFGITADNGKFEITRYRLQQPFSVQQGGELAGREDSNPGNTSPSGLNWQGSGSGIVLSKSGLIATNNHVIEDSRYIEVELKYNGEIKSFKAKIIKTDEINDLAILKIDDEKFTSFKSEIPYNFSTDIKKTGTKVYALGYPSSIDSEGNEGLMGKEIKFTDGRISAKTGIGGSPIFYQTTAPLQGGNSGGPLFDEKANLVGINTAILSAEKFENVSYSVKSRFLLNLIEVLSEDFELPNNYKTGRSSIEDQIEKIAGYVALIKVK